MNKAVLAFTDGYTITQAVYPSYEEAKRAMKDQYDRYYDEEADLDNDSYIGDNEAKVVRTHEDIWLWNIIVIGG